MAKVAVSKANLRFFCFGSCWALPLSLLLRCLALWRNANLAGGFAGRFLVVVLVVWLVSRDDLRRFLDHTSPVHYCFSLLTQL